MRNRISWRAVVRELPSIAVFMCVLAVIFISAFAFLLAVFEVMS